MGVNSVLVKGFVWYLVNKVIELTRRFKVSCYCTYRPLKRKERSCPTDKRSFASSDCNGGISDVCKNSLQLQSVTKTHRSKKKRQVPNLSFIIGSA